MVDNTSEEANRSALSKIGIFVLVGHLVDFLLQNFMIKKFGAGAIPNRIQAYLYEKHGSKGVIAVRSITIPVTLNRIRNGNILSLIIELVFVVASIIANLIYISFHFFVGAKNETSD